jgi:hypothetical protein
MGGAKKSLLLAGFSSRHGTLKRLHMVMSRAECLMVALPIEILCKSRSGRSVNPRTQSRERSGPQ